MDRCSGNDSCNPFVNKRLHTYRVYTVLLPVLVMVFVLECIYVFMTVPVSLGTAVTTTGPHSLSGIAKK